MSELIPPVVGIGPGLVKVGETHPEMVFVIADNDKAIGGGPFRDRFPERVFDVGIAEQNMVMTSAGMATAGKLPFCNAFGNFLALRCAEQIRTFVAHTRLNVKLIGGLAGVSGGKEGPTHEAQEDIAHMRAVPELVVLSPTDVVSVEKAVIAAAEWKGPVYIRVGRMPAGVFYDQSYTFRIGKADLARQGNGATIISTGVMLGPALEAAAKLASNGLEVRVLDMQTIKPLDNEAVLAAAKETGAIVTAEEHTIVGGLGGAVAEFLSENYPTPVVRVGINDVYAETGVPEQLMEAYGLTADNIVRAVRRALELKR
ncbi:MAG: transketolase family protein [Dehalococcoidales bacterium]|nr:transketolase family protein [Dehalococcoidales bacterium]